MTSPARFAYVSQDVRYAEGSAEDKDLTDEETLSEPELHEDDFTMLSLPKDVVSSELLSQPPGDVRAAVHVVESQIQSSLISDHQDSCAVDCTQLELVESAVHPAALEHHPENWTDEEEEDEDDHFDNHGGEEQQEEEFDIDVTVAENAEVEEAENQEEGSKGSDCDDEISAEEDEEEEEEDDDEEEEADEEVEVHEQEDEEAEEVDEYKQRQTEHGAFKRSLFHGGLEEEEEEETHDMKSSPTGECGSQTSLDHTLFEPRTDPPGSGSPMGSKPRRRLVKRSKLEHTSHTPTRTDSDSNSIQVQPATPLCDSHPPLNVPSKPLQETVTNPNGSIVRSMLTKAEKIAFNGHVTRAKASERGGELRQALLEYMQAASLWSDNTKLNHKIAKLQTILAEEEMDVNPQPDQAESPTHRTRFSYDKENQDVNIQEGGYQLPSKTPIRPLNRFAHDDDACCEEMNEFDWKLPVGMFKALLPYQREGVNWMWNLFHQNRGGILGDDMGLGKTIQTLSFLTSLFLAKEIRCVLLVLPVAVIEHWKQQLDRWCVQPLRNGPHPKRIRVGLYHGPSRVKREQELNQIKEKGGVCITTYGLVTGNHRLLQGPRGRNGDQWDCIILDEGHKIKNDSIQVSRNIADILGRFRLLITGTPLQNNFREFWSLFNFVCPDLLGSKAAFKREFETVIVRGNEKDATTEERERAATKANELRIAVTPCFLRREKKDVMDQQTVLWQAPSSSTGSTETVTTGPRKNDLTIWIQLSDTQIDLYRRFLDSPQVQVVLNTTASPLAALTVLKKICDHLQLVAYPSDGTPTQAEQQRLQRLKQLKGGDSEEDEDGDSRRIRRESIQQMQIEPVSFCNGQINSRIESLLLRQSGKLEFLMRLMPQLKSEGHKTLIFSQSLKMLDIIETLLTSRGHGCLRIDGTITSPIDRQLLIDRFNNDPRPPEGQWDVFLLSTKVGGLGINLTAADRVVLYSPAWNPSDDNQAVDRAFRIGQTRNVVAYRLITCGTIEEKIYRKQVFKGSLLKTVDVENDFIRQQRYFTRSELRDLFKLENPFDSQTQRQLAAKHSSQRRTDSDLEMHLDFVRSLGVFGISDHDLLFTDPDAPVSSDTTVESTILSDQHNNLQEPDPESINGRLKLEKDLDALLSDMTDLRM